MKVRSLEQPTSKQEDIAKVEKDFGVFVLINNVIKDSLVALETNRNKDLGEKAFRDPRKRLDLRRTAVSPESSLEGKVFVYFTALIYLS